MKQEKRVTSMYDVCKKSVCSLQLEYDASLRGAEFGWDTTSEENKVGDQLRKAVNELVER